jgi:hypothetical protein
MDFGKPVQQVCRETSPSVFSREWSKATVQMDCNTGTPTVTYKPDTQCDWAVGAALEGTTLTVVRAATKEECCAACHNQLDCTAAEYRPAIATCALKQAHRLGNAVGSPASLACVLH